MSDEVKTVCGKCKDTSSMLCAFTYPDSCPFAPILCALPTASDERRELALRVLTDGTVDTVRIAAAIAGIYQPEPQWEYGISGSSEREEER